MACEQKILRGEKKKREETGRRESVSYLRLFRKRGVGVRSAECGVQGANCGVIKKKRTRNENLKINK